MAQEHPHSGSGGGHNGYNAKLGDDILRQEIEALETLTKTGFAKLEEQQILDASAFSRKALELVNFSERMGRLADRMAGVEATVGKLQTVVTKGFEHAEHRTEVLFKTMMKALKKLKR